MTQQPPPHLSGNVAGWEAMAQDYVAAGERAWVSERPYWGIWEIPDDGILLLPEDLTGADCIELGCGTAYVSAWMHRRGGKVVAIDPTPAQLETAHRLQRLHGLDFTIVQGYAESVPFPDASFDFAISEYGAALWADPYQWIPEASRILRPGGQLVFLTNSPLLVMCAPEDESEKVQPTLLRPYFGLYKTIWPDTPEQTEFHLTHSAWIKLFRNHGFTVERLVELQVPEGAQTGYSWADAEWGRNWPTEEAWVLRKSAS